jgi:hypothetical protein
VRSIKEKLAYNLKYSPQLNPLIFEGGEMKPQVHDKILQIVNAFLEYAQVSIHIADIRLVGSNASYNYNEHSDLDIHIVTDLSKIADPEVIARLYFDSIKSNFKNSYDIKIKGIDVELYVEDINTSSVSNGIYSVSQNKWIKEPVIIEDPTDEEIEEAEKIENEIINNIMLANDVGDLEDIINNLYLMRKDSLASKGEAGSGNLAFKSLRNKGILDKVKDVIRDAESKELSLESKKIDEDLSPLKTLKGSVIKRSSKYGVGKEIGGQIYFHKNYVGDICPHLYELAKDILEEEHPDFKFNCLMYDKKKPDTLRFDEAPDFDTSREPMPGTMYSVDTDTGKITKRYSPQIWHHKWLWVKDDYTGFNVQESYEWSKKWLEKITSPSGYIDKWKSELKDAGLE